ncbi:hypothetical protein BV25DRAFT_1808942 [Artomyces pyxidatus]|uniref:Uncharacterized protein n=1 Tax=Artomyces pyxidatus TaxID=48021 RepID=A0ACB8STE2_9AGAM|nr:hypothetical protein BV25DRAFT_1808942 [Artomyces pyxidatus]
MAPPRKADPLHRMVFTTNSLRNTTIAVDDDALYYEIVTRYWHPNLTKIFKLDKEIREMLLIAELERVPGQPAKIRFGGEHGEWVSEEEFLRWDPETRGGTFTGGEGVQYRWKSHNRRLQLIRADDDQKVPLAKYHTYRRHFFVFRMSRHAFLEVKSEATEAMDKLIMSYLLVERKRRDTGLQLPVKKGKTVNA